MPTVDLGPCECCGGGGGGDPPCNQCASGSTISSLGQILTLTVAISDINFHSQINTLSDQSGQETVISGFFNSLSVPYQNPDYRYEDAWIFLGCIDGRTSSCLQAGDGSNCDSSNSLTINNAPSTFLRSTQGGFQGVCPGDATVGQFHRTKGFSTIFSSFPSSEQVSLVTALGCGLATVDGYENVLELHISGLVFDWDICSTSGQQKVSCDFESPDAGGLATYAAVSKPYSVGFLNTGYYTITGTAFLESELNPLP